MIYKFEGAPDLLMASAEAMRRLGNTALEIVDSNRLVRRLEDEHQTELLGQAAEGLEVAENTHNDEMVKVQACHILRIIVRGFSRSIDREQTLQEERLLLIKTILNEHLPDEDISSLGFTQEETDLLRRYL